MRFYVNSCVVLLLFSSILSKAFSKSIVMDLEAPIFQEFALTEKTVEFKILNDPNQEAMLENKLSAILMYWLIEVASNEQIESQFKAWGFSSTKILELRKLGFRGVVAEHSGYQFLIIKGTASKSQLVSNGKFDTVTMDQYSFPGKMHRGFAEEYQETSALIENALIAELTEGKPLITIGHSRGAAMGILHSVQLKQKLQIPLQIYAYAVPKIGDIALNYYLDYHLSESIITINFELDMTPNVPISQDALNYIEDEVPSLPGLLMHVAKGIITRYEYEHTPGAIYHLKANAMGLFKVSDKNLAQREYWSWFGDQIPDFSLPQIIKLFRRTPQDHKVPNYVRLLSRNSEL